LKNQKVDQARTQSNKGWSSKKSVEESGFKRDGTHTQRYGVSPLRCAVVSRKGRTLGKRCNLLKNINIPAVSKFKKFRPVARDEGGAVFFCVAPANKSEKVAGGSPTSAVVVPKKEYRES
jgi:hypothetical protein